MSYNSSICYCSAGMDACALWRMFIPHLNMPNSRFLFTQGVPPLDTIAESDTVCVQRMMTEGNLIFMQTVVKNGMHLIYDIDDHVWNVPGYNPAKQIFDKTKKEKSFEACMEWADVITVSTPSLKAFAEREVGHLRNVKTKERLKFHVLENYVDLNQFYPSGLKCHSDNIVIGWGGSNTHSGDLWEVWNMLPQIIEDFPNVEMEFVGMSAPLQLAGHERVRQVPWVHISEFIGRVATWDWDIFLAPLEVNPFNRCKSSIKMQEAAALGKPCLASDIENYTRFCLAGDKELAWQLCSVPSQWDRKLRELITNHELRKRLGLAMRKNVEDNFEIAKNIWRHQELSDMLASSK